MQGNSLKPFLSNFFWYAFPRIPLEIGGSKSGKVLKVHQLWLSIYRNLYKYEVGIRVTEWHIESLYILRERMFWSSMMPFSVIGFWKSGFVVHVNHPWIFTEHTFGDSYLSLLGIRINPFNRRFTKLSSKG